MCLLCSGNTTSTSLLYALWVPLPLSWVLKMCSLCFVCCLFPGIYFLHFTIHIPYCFGYFPPTLDLPSFTSFVGRIPPSLLLQWSLSLSSTNAISCSTIPQQCSKVFSFVFREISTSFGPWPRLQIWFKWGKLSFCEPFFLRVINLYRCHLKFSSFWMCSLQPFCHLCFNGIWTRMLLRSSYMILSLHYFLRSLKFQKKCNSSSTNGLEKSAVLLTKFHSQSLWCTHLWNFHVQHHQGL